MMSINTRNYPDHSDEARAIFSKYSTTNKLPYEEPTHERQSSSSNLVGPMDKAVPESVEQRHKNGPKRSVFLRKRPHVFSRLRKNM